MPYCKISHDLKLATVNLFEHNLLTIGQIVDCVGFTEHTFWHIMKLWREMGDVILHFEDVSYLLRLINHRPDWFLDEVLGMLESNHCPLT
ncbi:hypothetical protein BDR03DRAFT_877876 [Suillus americanus]|nr:hypothetical protein BDR03DRAFT_877876 [Suillus americanus]